MSSHLGVALVSHIDKHDRQDEGEGPSTRASKRESGRPTGDVQVELPKRSIDGIKSASAAGDVPCRSTESLAAANPGDDTATRSVDVEMSTPSNPTITRESATIIQHWRRPPITKWRVLATCLGALGQGFSDSAPGALLPYIEGHYNIGYATVSMIFVANAVGFIAAAFFVHILDRKLGRPWTLVLCEALNVIAFAVMIVPPPYAVFVLGYFVAGFGFATTLALNNVFCANVAPATTILGAFHGAYGIGGTIAPLIATTMVTSGIEFSRFYALLLGLRIVIALGLGLTFRAWPDQISSDTAQDVPLHDREQTSDARQTVRAEQGSARDSRRKSSQLVGALRSRVTLIGALFIFAYQGAEVSISGWVISFLITYRNGAPERVGYVTAGFWGGITVGRLALSPLAQRMGEKTSTYGLITGAIAFEVAVWKLQSVVGDSVFIVLLGLLLGPIFPCATVVLTRLLPRHLQNTAMAFIASAGSSGGALAPFATGLAAQAVGTWVLHPIAIGLYAVMMICWALLPATIKRRD